MKSRNKVSVSHAIDLYAEKHKKELKKVFGSLKNAKAHMKHDIIELPANYFKTHKQANQMFNDWYDRNVNPAKAELNIAKRDAINRNIWGDQRRLNRKMDPNDIKYSGSYLGTNQINGIDWDITATDFYEIKGESYNLVKVRANNGSSEFEYWEYVNKADM